MRTIKKHPLICLVLSLMVFALFCSGLERNAWRWVPTVFAENVKNLKTVKVQDAIAAAPTPTPVTGPPPAAKPTPTPIKKKGGWVDDDARAAQTDNVEGGILSGRMVSSVPANPVNLTSEGALDWAHWGNGGPTVFDHKSGVTQQISNYTVIGTGQVFWLGDNPTGFSWSDGTPGLSATNVHTGIFTIGLGNGLQFTVPADTDLKTIRVYLGLWRARGRLEATLSDGSAPQFVDTSLSNQLGTSNGTYTISFAAASPGQTLTIKYVVHAAYHTSGNVTLESATLVNGGDLDIPPAVSISSPSDEATFNAGETINLTANAFDPDGSVAAVNFFIDGFPLGAAALTGTNHYSLAWPAVFAGQHTVTATATDNEGATTTSDPISVTAFPVSGGTLTGKMHSTSPPLSINLTTEGSIDWAHWGNGGPEAFDHKAGVTQQISNMTLIGTSGVQWMADNPIPFSWTDGTPTVSATNNRTGIFVSSVNNGFEITVPADTNFKTLRLYTGLWYSQAKLEAALSDGSAPVFVDTSFGGTGTVFNAVYALSYRAASNGQTLRLRLTILSDYTPPFGNLTLESATLTNGGPPTVSLTAPSNGAVFNALDNIALTASASDATGTISKVQFFRDGSLFGEDTIAPYTMSWLGATAGTYSLTAVATNDKGITASSPESTIIVNSPPVVSAGYNQSIALPALATLYGAVADDGLPAPVTVAWSKVSGPGTVSFGNANSTVTTASFSAEGTYVLRLTANDGGTSRQADVSVGVYSAITMALNSTADAHVRDGSSAATNFGAATTIDVQTGNTNDNRDGYFKFDLTNAGDINNAKLRINAALSGAGSVVTSVYPVSNTSWTETTINWNNRPPLGSPALSSATINGTASAWYELDVTNYLISEKNAGRNIVTLALHNPSSSTVLVRVNSKEAASNKPQLLINTHEAGFIVSKTLGTVRNNFTGFTGMKLTVGPTPVVVTSLGRIFVSGNTGTHIVKLVTASSGADLAGGSVSINMAAGTPSNGFKYVALAAPVTLAANTAYYLVSQETSGGDQWYDSNTVLTTTPVAVVNNAIQRPNNTWQSVGSTNNSFVPVDFKYVSKTPPNTVTYHLHLEGSSIPATPPNLSLSTAGPDLSVTPLQTANLKGQANGEKLISGFDTQLSILGRPGYIPAGSTTTFSLWMRNTGTAGTMFPRAKLYVNNESGASICTATGATALSTTITKYTLSCTSTANITFGTSDRFYLWVGVNLTAGSSSKNFSAELNIEGTLNGNYNSQINTRLPLAPTIFSLSPNIGPTGASVLIAGTNFGPMQGGGSVSFNGQVATVTNWSSNSISTTVPVAAGTGPVIVTFNGAPSNGVTFTIGLADSDSDGLPDAWEIQFFGNLLFGPNDDSDSDGATNLQEFLQGRNPTLGTIANPNAVDLKLYSPVDP